MNETLIKKSLKELDDVVTGSNKKKHYLNKLFQPPKLDFSNSLNCTGDTTDNDSSFLSKHKQNIAGFDITKKIREKDTEIIGLKSSVCVLESKLESQKNHFKESQLKHDTQNEKLREQQQLDKDNVFFFKRRIAQMEASERKLRTENRQFSEESSAAKAEAERKVAQAFATATDKVETLQEKKDELETRVCALSKENKEKTSLLLSKGLQVCDLEDRAKHGECGVAEAAQTQLRAEVLEAKFGKSERMVMDLERRLEALSDQEKRKEMLEKALTQVPLLQATLAKLKDENSSLKMERLNENLLQEKAETAHSRLEDTTARLEDALAENATLKALREISEHYEKVISEVLNVDPLPPPDQVSESLKALRMQDDRVASSISELKASVASHSSWREDQDTSSSELSLALQQEKEATEKNRTLIRRLQRKIFLLSKERDSLKEILSTYESESTVMGVGVQASRLGALESQLDDYKEEIKRLEEELDVLQAMPKNTIAENSKKRKRTEEMDEEEEKREEKRKKKNEEKEKELERLRGILAENGINADFDPAKERILHFAANPLDLKHEAENVEKLKEELDTLRHELRICKEMGGGEGVADFAAVTANKDKEITDLSDKVKQGEQRQRRLLEAFQNKSSEMRDVVQRLTGYRVDFRRDNRYRLASVYADSSTDSLLFETTRDGEFQLLETEFSTTLSALIETYLHREHSYPAFLAALTLQLFGRQRSPQSSSASSEDEINEEEGIDEQESGDERNEEREDSEDMDRQREDDDESDDEGDDDEGEDEEGDDEGEEEERERVSEEEDADEDDDDELICLD